MYLKNNYVVYFLLFILFAFVTLYLNPNFDFSLNSLKHWSTYNRDDIVFVYGTLIYNEGYDQHHLDHPSLFTFIVLPPLTIPAPVIESPAFVEVY